MPDYRGISPEVDGQANLGSSTQMWGKVYAKVIPGAFNKKETFTTSGSFTAPYTGVYKITLQGGGGGGGAAGVDDNIAYGFSGGGGGGQGGHYEFYVPLTQGTSYSYTVGVGGAGGIAGSTITAAEGAVGGATSITIGGTSYVAAGGGGGKGAGSRGTGGNGGEVTVGGTIVARGATGTAGGLQWNSSLTTIRFLTNGTGGGPGGGGSLSPTGGTLDSAIGVFGGGGSGGYVHSGNYYDGYAGGGGYITFEYYDPSLI